MSMNKQDDTRRSAKLYDESGLLVAKGHVPASEELTTTSEGMCNRPPGCTSVGGCCLASKHNFLPAGISAFEGWIVNIDSECLLQDLPGQSTFLTVCKCQSSLLSTAHMRKSLLWHSSHAS